MNFGQFDFKNQNRNSMDLYGRYKFGSLCNYFSRRVTGISVDNETTWHIIVLGDIVIDSICNGVSIRDFRGCIESEGKYDYRCNFRSSECHPSIWLSSCTLISTPIFACCFNGIDCNVDRLVCMEVAQTIGIK